MCMRDNPGSTVTARSRPLHRVAVPAVSTSTTTGSFQASHSLHVPGDFLRSQLVDPAFIHIGIAGDDAHAAATQAREADDDSRCERCTQLDERVPIDQGIDDRLNRVRPGGRGQALQYAGRRGTAALQYWSRYRSRHRAASCQYPSRRFAIATASRSSGTSSSTPPLASCNSAGESSVGREPLAQGRFHHRPDRPCRWTNPAW